MKETEKKKKCKYCEGVSIVTPFDKKEAKLYTEHLRHKYKNQ